MSQSLSICQRLSFNFPSKTNLWTKTPCSRFVKFDYEIKFCWKTRLHVNFGPFFGTKRWITLGRKNVYKIANRVLDKRQLKGSVPNFKTKALAVWKLKGKENCENEHRETVSFMYNFVEKTNATKQLWWHFMPTSPLHFFHTVFTRRSALKGILRSDQKGISSKVQPLAQYWVNYFWRNDGPPDTSMRKKNTHGVAMGSP